MKLSDIQYLSKSLSNLPQKQVQEEMVKRLIQLGYDPNNFYQELEMESMYVDTHRDISYSNGMVQLHSHNFYEILYCRNTCGAEYLVDSNRYKLQKGDIILIPPGISHRPILPDNMKEPYIRDILWLSNEFIIQLLNIYKLPIFNEHHYLLRTSNTKYEYIGDIFQKGILENEHKEFGYESVILGNTISLLTDITRIFLNHESQTIKAENSELFDQITSYIETNFEKKISLQDISSKFYISETGINLLFRDKIGTSFYKYLTQRRLIHAKTLIQNGISLEDVANMVGYLDYSTFYRSFKHEFGISPRTYRMMIK